MNLDLPVGMSPISTIELRTLSALQERTTMTWSVQKWT